MFSSFLFLTYVLLYNNEKYMFDNDINEKGKNLPYSFTYDEILKAYEDCMSNKRNTANAIKFSVDYITKLIALCDEINNGTYEIGSSITFIVKFPVLREVFAADFRDRIVHHLVINELMQYFEQEFIDESFSCRKGKGVLYGVNTMYEKVRECTENYTKDAWIVKLDIKSFFMSIDKQLLANMVDDMIVRLYPENRKKQKLRDLCKQIILHQPQLNCTRRGDLSLWEKLPFHKSLFHTDSAKGLAIGNLTSQIFANYYMNLLDHYIKDELGFKYYGRYVDDLCIISTDREKLINAIPLIVKFAEEKLLLKVHPNKRYMQYYKNGVKFIGGVLKCNRKFVINRTVGSLIFKLKSKFGVVNEKNLMDLLRTVNSYLGFIGQFDSYNIRKRILSNKELIGQWLPYIDVDENNYRKITLKNNPESKRIKNIREDIEMLDECEYGENVIF